MNKVEVEQFTLVTTKRWRLEELNKDMWRVYLDDVHLISVEMYVLDELRAAVEAAIRETRNGDD